MIAGGEKQPDSVHILNADPTLPFFKYWCYITLNELSATDLSSKKLRGGVP